jgi:G6PDH family F420-dependent oxidoreductase
MRIHPVVVAHAAATAATLLPDRFFLGVGTGENLNEHVLGEAWPDAARRRAMLEESIDVIRELWSGRMVRFDGEFYRVENAQLFSLPDRPPPIVVAAGGPSSAALAARAGDGLITVGPNGAVVEDFRDAGGEGPRYAEMAVVVADDEEEALRTALERWPNAGLPSALSTELALPQHFEAAASLVREEDLSGSVVVGPDPRRYEERLRAYHDAGFDRVFLHQIGHDQERFVAFAHEELIPRIRRFSDDVAA